MSDALGRRRVLQLGVAAGLLGACGSRNATPPAPTTTPSPLPPTSVAPPPDAKAGTPLLTDGPVSEIAHGPRDVPRVALTFHGAGEPALATALLDEAEKAGARLTVLAVGIWLAANPGLARRILDGGHELGNHTWSHPTMTRLSEAAAQSEIERCAALLKKLTGTQQVWFRPSGTPHATPTILAAAARAGYTHALSYDVDSLDYTDPGAARIVRNTATAQPGSVVSMHLGHRGTVEALPAVLDQLKERRLTPVTVSTLLTPT